MRNRAGWAGQRGRTVLMNGNTVQTDKYSSSFDAIKAASPIGELKKFTTEALRG